MLLAFDLPFVCLSGSLLLSATPSGEPPITLASCILTAGLNFFSIHCSGETVLEVKFPDIVRAPVINDDIKWLSGEVQTHDGNICMGCPADSDSYETMQVFLFVLVKRVATVLPERAVSHYQINNEQQQVVETQSAMMNRMRERSEQQVVETQSAMMNRMRERSEQQVLVEGYETTKQPKMKPRRPNGIPLVHQENPVQSIITKCRSTRTIRGEDEHGITNLGESFVDPLFTPAISRIWLEQHLQRPIRFVRLSEYFPNSELFDNEVLELGSIEPGCLNSTWILHLIKIAVEYANIDLQIQFHPQEKTSCGVYSVRFHLDGAWRYVLVDDIVPIIHDGGASILPCPVQGTYWLPLLVKAVAKYHGSYEAVNLAQNISPGLMLCDLTGAIHLASLPQGSPGIQDLTLLRGHQEAGDMLIVTSKDATVRLPSWAVFMIANVDAATGLIVLNSLSESYTLSAKDLFMEAYRVEILRFFTSWNEASLAGQLEFTAHPQWFAVIIPEDDTFDPAIPQDMPVPVHLFISVRRKDPRIPHEDDEAQGDELPPSHHGHIRMVLASDGFTTNASGLGDMLEPINIAATVSTGVHMLELSVAKIVGSDAHHSDMASPSGTSYTLRVLCSRPFSLEQKLH